MSNVGFGHSGLNFYFCYCEACGWNERLETSMEK